MQRFERRVEGLVNRVFARTFKSEVQPVEIAAALRREADDRVQVVSRERSMVPNSYVVELGPHDHERLLPWEEPLSGELVEILAEHAAAQGYLPAGPLQVVLERHDDLETGVFRVRSAADAHAAPAPPLAPPPAPAPPVARPAAPVLPPPAPQLRAPVPPEATAVFAAPRPVLAQPWLDVAGVRHPLVKAVTVVGRGSEADVRLEDPGVSRRHVQIQVAGERARLVDLGSTNGTLVEGQRVRELELVDGTAFVLGRTTVTYRGGRDREDRYDDGGGRDGRGSGPVRPGGESFIPGLR
ncbi:FhaA domain-containing protein [Motilibacter rhizosphaerae]|nr:DUF3662 and FHA domain-containing protein [Motilibacter rhizosphaerae]